MTYLNFTHHFTNCEPHQLQQAAYVALHTICFHRFLGTLRPASISAFGLTFLLTRFASVHMVGFWIWEQQPAIADTEIDQLLQQRSTQLFALLSTSPAPKSAVEIVIYFLRPSSSKPSSPSAARSETKIQDTATQTNSKTAARTETPPSGASSLRAWASSRNLQYAWLAQAFSSGAGQAAAILPSTPETALHEDLEAEAFERWNVVFNLLGTDVLASKRIGLKQGMAHFVDKVLQFVQANKAHLPPFSGAELVTFPVRIVVRAG
ncbi:uncharacterized protein UTRI_04108 [Ustilago trichophora]|uniref:Autophagy-related protein 101 n=1 Tax=Ustilago trichophora TaxID=86804 RepID=A0A5C3EBG5_9BASI|nr:uncharacterized protein UTRI_04108 [Ustilago trichophora]